MRAFFDQLNDWWVAFLFSLRPLGNDRGTIFILGQEIATKLQLQIIMVNIVS